MRDSGLVGHDVAIELGGVDAFGRRRLASLITLRPVPPFSRSAAAATLELCDFAPLYEMLLLNEPAGTACHHRMHHLGARGYSMQSNL